MIRAAKRGILLAGCSIFAAEASAQTVASPPPEPTSSSIISDPGANISGGDIVVTARKRSESLQSVPVTVTAVTGATLAARGIVTLEGFARTVPQLFLANSSGSFQGGAIGLRGISAGDGNVFGDQAVAFNIDGVLIARSSPRRFQQFDIGQVEILKGPQALYYGKNSPGGVVAIRTADPTDQLSAGGKIAYEFNAREIRGEAFVAGPITENLGVRVAVLGSRMRGWVTNIATPGTAYSPDHQHLPRAREFNGRVTVKYEDGPLTARLKVNYGHQSDDGQFNNVQRIFCPRGVAQLGGNDDCTGDDRAVHASIGTRVGIGGSHTITGAPLAGVPFYGDGDPYSRSRQYLTGLEISYDLGSDLTLVSNTGYYDFSTKLVDVSNAADGSAAFNPALGPSAASGMLAAYADLGLREFSQELRLSSSFDGPVNFMMGVYYQHQKGGYENANTVNTLNPIQLNPPVRITQDGDAISPFGSVSWKVTDTIELSGGARYSYEKKTINFYRLLPGTLAASLGGASYAAGQEVPTTVPKRSFNNVSPEATLTWRPNSEVTAYGSYKQGFLSGGFSAAGPNTNFAIIPDQSYGQQLVKGFEGGLKLLAFDRALRVNLAAYTFRISGLQVAAVLPGPPVRQIVSNAASARSEGAEADFNWQTPLEGLSFRGAISFNNARYKRYGNASCYAGQTIGLGCNLAFNGTVFTAQDLSGFELVRAPRWAGSAGVTYEIPMADGSRLALSADTNLTSRYSTEAVGNPASIQRGYGLIDASATLELAGGLNLAFIGRNLTNKYYFQRSSTAPFTNGPSGTAASSLGDQIAYVSRGREFVLQVGYRF